MAQLLQTLMCCFVHTISAIPSPISLIPQGAWVCKSGAASGSLSFGICRGGEGVPAHNVPQRHNISTREGGGHDIQAWLVTIHNGSENTGVAVSHCITWFQTQLILPTCQIRYYRHLWDHRGTGQL